MKPAFIVFARDKAKHVRATVAGVLAQNYAPMEILLSDQGSEDGTLQILEDMAQRYNGPNKVRVLRCPDLEPRGMAGANAHLNWLHTQTDADLIIVTSADDLNHPERAQRIVETYREFQPSLIGTGTQFIQPNTIPWWMIREGETVEILKTAHPGETRFIAASECLKLKIGGSCAMAWTHELYSKYGPLTGSICQDMALPFWAILERGFYYVDECLHAYVRHADPNNTGLDGARLAADDAGKAQIDETAAYQITSTVAHIAFRAAELHPEGSWDEAQGAITEALMERTVAWVMARNLLTQHKISPIPLRS